MRIGFHNPFEGAVGGGDRYLFTMLDEAARLDGAELVVLSPRPPDPDAWERVGVSVDPGAYAWEETRPPELTERSRELDLLVTLDADVPTASAARHSICVIQFPFRARDRADERVLAAALRTAGRQRAPAALASAVPARCSSHPSASRARKASMSTSWRFSCAPRKNRPTPRMRRWRCSRGGCSGGSTGGGRMSASTPSRRAIQRRENPE